MAAVTGLNLTKEFTYRGDNTEEFSNTYHFRGAPPGDAASWLVLANDLWNQEQTIFTSDVKLVSAYGYDSDNPEDHSVWSHDFSADDPPKTGTFPGVSGKPGAGDQAACLQFKLDRKNTRGKWIYLRKYYHRVFTENLDADTLEVAYQTAINVFGNFLVDAQFHGGLRAQRYDAQVTHHQVIPWVTTRTLKRRGKRPLPKA